MAKIKGWTKVKVDADSKYRWITNNGRGVVVIERMNLNGLILVTSDIGKLGMADTYEGARNIAMIYMRSHPNG
jgi:hypothetical protein